MAAAEKVADYKLAAEKDKVGVRWGGRPASDREGQSRSVSLFADADTLLRFGGLHWRISRWAAAMYSN